MRIQGLPITKIALELGVSKGSVSTWCRGIVISQDQKDKIKADKLKAQRKDKTCSECGEKFRQKVEIDGKTIQLWKRDKCLDCQPLRVPGSSPMRNGDYLLIVAPPDYPGMHYRDKYCYEHTYVYWKNTGTLPGPDDVIHHKNENQHDNRFGNLELKTRAKHTELHGHLHGKILALLKCPTCGVLFVRAKRQFYHQVKRVAHCSRRCGALRDKPYLAENIVGMFRYSGTMATVEEAEAILATG